MRQTRLITQNQWTLRRLDPLCQSQQPWIVLLHGLTGDENVMWIFTTHIPDQFQILAPRGLYPASPQGFSWVDQVSDDLVHLDDFRPAVEALLSLLDALSEENAFHPVHLVGFSQGAALSYAIALLHPERVASVSGLSGFLPAGAELSVARRPLAGRSIFIAHGRRDRRVSIARGRDSVRQLEIAGGEVTYCEAEVGHKLSAECLRALGNFYRRMLNENAPPKPEGGFRL